MIIDKRKTSKQPFPTDVALLSDLHREIARLEAERVKAASYSDKLLSQLCSDDTGFTFHKALNQVNGLNQRIQQLRNLAEKVGSRV